MEFRMNPNGDAKKQPPQQQKSKSTSALPSQKSRAQDKENYKDSAQYKVYSKSSILADVKNTAASGISNVKQFSKKFSSLTTLLKQAGKSKTDPGNYSEFSNLPTPVKLYSPFSIETPQQLRPEEKLKLREQLFASPNNCLKQDVEGLEYGFNELNMISNQIEHSYKSKSNVSRSIFDNENYEQL